MINDIGAGAPTIEHAQTVLTSDEIESLWVATNKGTTKDALREAVAFTIKYKKYQAQIDKMVNALSKREQKVVV